MRPRVVVLVGLPGSGKSTWARRQGGGVLSTDELRALLSDDATNQNIHGMVFATMRYLLRRRLELAMPLTFIDATNTTPQERRAWIKLAQWFGARPEAVFFDVPPEVCKRRNRSRDRVVPEWAIDAMSARLRPPSDQEGFECVTVYNAETDQNLSAAPRRQ